MLPQDPATLAGIKSASQLQVDTKNVPLTCAAVSQIQQDFFTWHEEVKQGPQLQNIILDGRPTQQKAVLRTDALACLQAGVAPSDWQLAQVPAKCLGLAGCRSSPPSQGWGT